MGEKKTRKKELKIIIIIISVQSQQFWITGIYTLYFIFFYIVLSNCFVSLVQISKFHEFG